MSDLLFVYGSLRPAAGHPHGRRLAAEATALGVGSVAGRLYDLGDYPGLVLEAGPERVRGEVFRLAAGSPLWPLLDAYEAGDAMNPEFVRTRAVVTLACDGARLDCALYVYRGSVAGRAQVLGGDWLRHMGATPRPVRR
jgi:gamma-glutamylcyclotransferase (GGCT)/AIG2-like uncharacterized protein YtfP